MTTQSALRRLSRLRLLEYGSASSLYRKQTPVDFEENFMRNPVLGRPALMLMAVAASLTLSATAASAAAKEARVTEVYVIQGVPGSTVEVSIDGKSVGAGLKPKDIAGPLNLSQGKHEIAFEADDWSVDSSFTVAGASLDVVVHWPADIVEEPTVTVFKNDTHAVPADKGRLTVAHTAVVPPADVLVDRQVLFNNIANGEFVNAVVPNDTYAVSIVPVGQKKNPLLGPVDLPVEAGALTRVFAIGQPKNGSMDVVVQVIPVSVSGSPAPGSVDAGEAGLAATSVASEPSAGYLIPGLVLVTAVGSGALLVAARRRRIVS